MKDLYNLRVAKTLTDYDIVLNAGEADGVKVGMTFVVFSIGDEIVDPDTGESLGHLEIVKGRVRVSHVQAKISTARSNETFERRVPRGTAVEQILGTRPADYVTATKILDGVQVGDFVRRTS
ncbi:MAG: hypothetical protein SGJ23_06100 [Alphaproteobacteria bacterium]|nr:hypothetical protein [Alphaproteobacteria bacterium]